MSDEGVKWIRTANEGMAEIEGRTNEAIRTHQARWLVSVYNVLEQTDGRNTIA